MKPDVSHAVLSFLTRGYLLKESNKTLITLILKIPVPNTFKDFRPIGLCNTVYKIISKCLVNRLQPLMDKVFGQLITPFQNGFVKGRSITDNLILVSELMTFIQKSKRRKKHWCALKLDITKAYDKLSWNFLEAVLQQMHFSELWIRLLMGTVRSVSYTLLLNGQMAGSFVPECGLQQVDPLSPYLFIICANVLSCMLLRLESSKQLKGISFGNSCPPITHLMYVDDVVLFFQPTVDSCKRVAEVLQKYARLAGQEMNKAKSKIVFSPNVPRLHKRLLASCFGISYSPSLGRYLGSNLDHHSTTTDLFNELLQSFNHKLAGWKSKLLSQAGRLTLATSVLQSLPLY